MNSKQKLMMEEETPFIYSPFTLSTISHTNIKLKKIKPPLGNTSLSLLSLLEGGSRVLACERGGY